MGRFLRGLPVELTLLPGGKARLERNVAYEADDGTIYSAPSGMVFDGASIPRSAWSWIGHPYDHRYLPAAIIHDWLYQTQHTTRRRADDLFREALRANGVNRVRATTMWLAVRAGGGNGWREKAKPERREAA
jgi:hypothetical protein